MGSRRDLKDTLLFRYGIAIALSMVALIVMQFFETTEEVTALQIPLVAVTLTSLSAGFLPGVLAVLICSIGGAYLYLGSNQSMLVDAHGENLHWWLFNVLALVLAIITARLRSALIQNQKLRIQYEELYLEARKAVKARDEVLSIVSHDLRNFLGSILMNSQILLRSTVDPKRPAELIKRSGDQMNGLIENLLSVVKIDAGHLSLEVTSGRIGDLVDEALDLIQPLAEQKSIQLERSIADQELTIECDHQKIIRVFSNLLGNSVKFVDTGGKIVIYGQRENNSYRFAIEDTGPGISEDHLPHVFDRFWQEKKTAHKGTGLGLSIVKGIVEAHHGKIWVKSKFGEGSTFYFTLPLKQSCSDIQVAGADSSEKRSA